MLISIIYQIHMENNFQTQIFIKKFQNKDPKIGVNKIRRLFLFFFFGESILSLNHEVREIVKLIHLRLILKNN